MSSTTTAPRPLAHLHCHSQFSMLDGANRLPDLVAKVKAEGMNAGVHRTLAMNGYFDV